MRIFVRMEQVKEEKDSGDKQGHEKDDKQKLEGCNVKQEFEGCGVKQEFKGCDIKQEHEENNVKQEHEENSVKQEHMESGNKRKHEESGDENVDDDDDNDSLFDDDAELTHSSDEDYCPSPKKAPKKRVAIKKEPKSPKKSPPKKRLKVEKSEDGTEEKPPPKKRVKAEKPPKVKKERVKKVPQPRKKRKVDKVDETNETQAENVNCSENNSSVPAETNATSNDATPVVINNLPDNQQCIRMWSDEDVVSENTNVPIHIVRNVIKLLNQECTIPFIARYRKEMTGNIPVEKIRDIQVAYENVKALRKRVDNILKTIAKENKKIDSRTIFEFLNAKSIEDVELLYAPFKPGSKKSLAERSKQLGLEPYANNLLEAKTSISIMKMSLAAIIDPKKPGVANEDEVIKGIQHIIADVFAKDSEILDYMHHHYQRQYVQITASKSPAVLKEEKKAYIEGKEVQNFKFENYYNFRGIVKTINAHQVLALNRGESQKVLTVKYIVPDRLKNDTFYKCRGKFFRPKDFDYETSKFLNSCLDDAYNRLLEPQLIRQIRSELTKKAAKESCEVFFANLKRLLLTPPVRGKTVIGIDPGFKHGCKVAAVSLKGEVLCTDVVFPHKGGNFDNYVDAQKLIDMVLTYRASIVAIGNGTACRETEAWLSDMIRNKAFHPHEVKYCIVNESGASIYSVSKEADADLPGLDPNLRSAVSIARRLQDPLLEYVKIEPKHIGVGMYQHDLPETMLKTALDSVVVECVSFVGVDLNVCPEILLRKISGLSVARAKQIIEWREKNGCFLNRQQLLDVKGLGKKSFEQCAGFVKVLPQTSVDSKVPSASDTAEETVTTGKKKTAKSKKTYTYYPLDSTIIHPESYELAEKLLADMQTTVAEIGKESLFRKVSGYMRNTSFEFLATKFEAPAERIKLIIEAFKQPIEYDIREEFDVPLFQTGVKCLEDLKSNQVLTGRVTNVTHFGAFVDIGVGRNGLIHISKMRNKNVQLGDTVSVIVLSVNIPKKKIELGLAPP